MVETLFQDVRLAIRGFQRNVGVTLLALASLAIGIAANATIFSLVQAVEFPQLIYPDASRIVFLESRNATRALDSMPTSAPDALDIAKAASTLEHATLTADQSSILTYGDRRLRVGGRRVGSDFFTVMRVAPQIGRALQAGDQPGVMVLSDATWRNEFGADPSVLNRAVRLDEGSVTIVGVMPPRFDADADFWTPLEASISSAPRDDRQFTMFARLADGRSLADAEHELHVISERLVRDHALTNAGWVTVPIALPHLHGRDSRGAFFMLQGAVTFVLLIVCANVANLQLALGTRRTREMALRLSLGAPRARLIRQLLTESLVLALGGGAFGVLLALWGIQLAKSIGGFPLEIQPALNLPVLTFTAGVSMLTGVLSGLMPALRASSTSPQTALRADDGRTSSDRRGRVRSALVALQIASAVVLVVCAALMTQTFENRQRVDLGFDATNAVQGSLSLGSVGRDDATRRAAVDRLLVALTSNNNVQSAGASAWALPTGAGGERVITRTIPDGTTMIHRGSGAEAVTPDFFAALGVPLKAGRTFTNADSVGAAPVAIINDTLARAMWGDASPIGQTLRLGATDAPNAPVVTVVGVVGSIRRSAMHNTTIARVYLPFAQHPSDAMTVTVRGRTDTTTAARALEAAVRAVDPTLLAEDVKTVEADLAQFIAPMRMITLLLATFGVIGLLLAALGVFGMMSYVVSQQERELAVRTALGATHFDIMTMVVRSALLVTISGIVPGILAALLAARTLQSLLYGVSATDPSTFVGVALFLAIVSLGACYRPARAAATVDLMRALSRE